MHPIRREDIVVVGKVGKSIGLKGDHRLILQPAYEEAFYDWAEQASHVLIQLGGCFVPLPFTEVHEDQGTIRLGVLHQDEMERLPNAPIAMLNADLPAQVDDQFLRFDILLQDGTPVGKIVDVMDNGGQLLAEVEHTRGQRRLIPIVKSWITNLDHEAGQIIMELPEGLLEL